MKNFALFLSCLFGIGACSTLNVDLPSITDQPTGTRLPGKIVWRDLLTNDPQASQRFYGELFGWEFERAGSAANLMNDSDYTLIRHNGELIGGMVDTVALNNRSDISQWVVLMSVADIEAEVDRVRAAGGEVVTAPTDVQRRGRLAVVRDPKGALIGLLESRDGDPEDRAPEVGGFLWDELWTDDVEGSVRLYSTLGQLQSEDHDVDKDAAPDYRVLKSGDRPRVGIMPNPLEGLSPVWITYIRSDDPAATTARVAEYGGKILVEAQPRPLGGEVAFVAGPSGAGIALQTWPLDSDRENNE